MWGGSGVRPVLPSRPQLSTSTPERRENHRFKTPTEHAAYSEAPESPELSTILCLTPYSGEL